MNKNKEQDEDEDEEHPHLYSLTLQFRPKKWFSGMNRRTFKANSILPRTSTYNESLCTLTGSPYW